MRRICVIGAGGHGKVIVTLLRELGHCVDGILDDDPQLEGQMLCGVPILGPVARASELRFTHGVIAIGNNRVRREIANRLSLKWLTLVHPRAHVDPSVSLGEGTVVFAGSVIQTDASIGRHVIVNTSASVDHDCCVGDFVHVAPGTHVAGRVTIEEGGFLGIGSSVIPDVRIGAWSRVAAGGVVIRDLAEGQTAFGVPAQPRSPVSGNGKAAHARPSAQSAPEETNGHSTKRKPEPAAGTAATASPRLYLSPPHMSGSERELLLEAFDSNWIAPLGPHVDAFEREFAEVTGREHAVALSSGTAALHLALILMGVEPGDDVITSTLTFAATANAIRYLGANPVFIDSDDASWNMDPELLDRELHAAARRGKMPKAVICVDVFGQCADYEAITKICRFHEVPLIEDAAEALGAAYQDRPAGAFGEIACFSFNGNKIITTSGGGMLVTDRADWAARVRHLSTQARDPAPHYEHSEVGYNYRMSNLLAAVGRGQLQSLAERVRKRRAIFARYVEQLGDLPGISFMPEIEGGHSTRWLTCILVDAQQFGATREDIRLALDRENIEARPVWKPMHLQPAHQHCARQGGAVSERLFDIGLCLPSGSSMTEEDQQRVINIVRSVASPVRRLASAEV